MLLLLSPHFLEPFGFSLGKKVVLRPAVYGVAIARPVDVDQLVPPSNGWLIPPLKGDVVVAVNGVSQLNKTYDEVLAAVNTAGDSFRLTLTTPKLPVTRSMSEWSVFIFISILGPSDRPMYIILTAALIRNPKFL